MNFWLSIAAVLWLITCVPMFALTYLIFRCYGCPKPKRIKDAKVLPVFMTAILLASTASAGEVKAVINGAKTKESAIITVKPGDRLTLDGSQSTGEEIKYRWTPPEYEPQFRDRPGLGVSQDGMSCVVPTWPMTRYPYQLTVWNKDDVNTMTFIVVVEGCNGSAPNPSPTPPQPPEPTPAPAPMPVPTPPQPPPQPIPVPPAPERFGVAAQIPIWAARVNSPNRVEEARAMASLLQALATSSKLDAYSGLALVSQVAAELQTLTDAAARAHLPEWKREFGAPFGAFVVSLVNSGKLRTVADWKAFLLEVVQGLMRVV